MMTTHMLRLRLPAQTLTQLLQQRFRLIHQKSGVRQCQSMSKLSYYKRESMEGVEIRAAVAGDKAAILNIGDVLFGLDYLPAYFDEVFIDCPLAKPFVAVYRREIVGFCSAFLVDDGATAISRGARTKPELSGRGIYKKLTAFCLNSTNARVNAFTAVNNNTKVIQAGSSQQADSRLLTRLLTRYNFDTKEVKREDITPNPDVPNLLTPALLQFFMTTSDYKNYLFPDDRIIIDWVPFRLLPSNIPIIWQRDQQSLRLSDVRVEDGKMKGLMSNGNTYQVPGGLFVCILDIYGTDDASVRRHLVSHLRFVCKQTAAQASMLVFADRGLNVATIESVFWEFGVVKMDWKLPSDPDSVFSAQYLFEKKLLTPTAW